MQPYGDCWKTDDSEPDGRGYGPYNNESACAETGDLRYHWQEQMSFIEKLGKGCSN